MVHSDPIVSAAAWDRLVRDYQAIDQDDDFACAELLRIAVQEVEG